MNALVVGGTGTVGSEVVARLLSKGSSVRVLTRSAEKSGAIPAGANGAVGSLQEPDTLRAVFTGMEVVFLATAVAQDETAQGLAAVEAAKSAGVRRLVYMSVHSAEEARHIPHFGGKVPVEQAIRESRLEYTILRPNNFYQNDFWFRDPMLQYGVYPQPLGNIGLNRIDVRDIADAAVNALTQPGHNGAIYPLNGPDRLTGESTAEIYSRHLGKTIRYGGDDLDAWAAQSKDFYPDWLLHDLRIMFEHFQRKGLLATPEELAQQYKVVGHPPRAFDAFVKEIAPTWLESARSSTGRP